MDHLRCVVERITYQNEENGYAVIKCRAKGYPELVTVVGSMPDVHVGSVLTMEGEWKIDRRFGRQFSAMKWEESLPATALGIEKYLGSGLIKGLGPKMARRIVEAFGDQTLEVIESDPEKLSRVQGIGKKRAARILSEWEAQKEIRNIMLFLQSHDVAPAHAARIYKAYGNDAIRIVRENPYRLADDIWGIGFRTADQIAAKMGIGKDRFMRLRSGILYTLHQFSDQGHCFARRTPLIERASELLEAEKELLEFTLDDMIRAKDVIAEKEEESTEGDLCIWLPAFFHAERGVARRIRTILSAARERTVMEDGGLISRIENRMQICYDPIQRDAILTAIHSKLMVLTGGPGTGKTTVTRAIIAAYRESGFRVLLAAPTGRAAKRMSEAAGMEACTIHRLLEAQPPGAYKKNEENPVEGDVLIVDECSMIDLILMYNLLKALQDSMTLILIGDTDQLPSVGAGNVLCDIISSGAVPVIRLERIFRQAQGSRIIMNAHRINRGEPLDLRGGKESDFFFIEEEDQDAAVKRMVSYCVKNLPDYYRVDPLRDIQVLTPMQKGAAGAVHLNTLLQQAMNPEGPCLMRGGISYRLHDKVMQIRNNYDKEVYNGDIGLITAVNTGDRELTVSFDGRNVGYDVSELDELVLAYATTIHKAQGSEYPIVVLPLQMSHYIMLQRNLLYTAVTRAKKVLVIFGERKALACAVRNNRASVRNTRLSARLAGEAAAKAASGQAQAQAAGEAVRTAAGMAGETAVHTDAGMAGEAAVRTAAAMVGEAVRTAAGISGGSAARPAEIPAQTGNTPAARTFAPVVTVRRLTLSGETERRLRHRFIAFDTETTGLSPERDRICELGAVLFENGTAVRRFETLVNPDVRMSYGATKVNHITDRMLYTAPSEREVYPRLMDFFTGAGEGGQEEILLCAHNARFDMAFLKSALERNGIEGRLLFVDTLELSRQFLRRSPDYRLGTVGDFFGIVNREAHRAAADAEVCGQILCRLLEYRRKLK